MKTGWIMLMLTISLYIAVAFSDLTTAVVSLEKSYTIFKDIVFILFGVVLLIAFFNTFVNSKKIVKYIGKESGLKGWLIALFGGVISHGSTTIWYPILLEMLNSGAKKGLVVAFLYARAIKLPWLPVMVGYFGITFTLLLSVYILLGAFLQGWITEKVV